MAYVQEIPVLSPQRRLHARNRYRDPGSTRQESPTFQQHCTKSRRCTGCWGQPTGSESKIPDSLWRCWPRPCSRASVSTGARLSRQHPRALGPMSYCHLLSRHGTPQTDPWSDPTVCSRRASQLQSSTGSAENCFWSSPITALWKQSVPSSDL